MFTGMILTLTIKDQGRMLTGQFLNLMTLPSERPKAYYRGKGMNEID